MNPINQARHVIPLAKKDQVLLKTMNAGALATTRTAGMHRISESSRAVNKSGHYRGFEFTGSFKKSFAQKEPDEPAWCQKAREMLSWGRLADDIAKELGVSLEAMRKFLYPQWQGVI